MGNGLCLAGLDIRSIESSHETSTEPSTPPGDDDITSRYLLPMHTRCRPYKRRSCNEIGPSHEFKVITCGSCHQVHRNTSQDV
eukprot:6052034-Prymnesium_polylepis.1